MSKRAGVERQLIELGYIPLAPFTNRQHLFEAKKEAAQAYSAGKERR